MLDTLNIGEFDRFVTIQEELITRDTDYNAEVTTYQTYLQVYAKRIYKNAGEKIEDNKDNEVIKRGYLIRFIDDVEAINGRMRLIDNGDIFYITGVDGGRREGYFTIMCERRVST